MLVAIGADVPHAERRHCSGGKVDSAVDDDSAIGREFSKSSDNPGV